MWEPFFGFKKTPFSDNPDGKQLFASQGWNQVNARLQFLVEHHAIGLLTGEVGAGSPPPPAPSSLPSTPVCTRSSTCTGLPDPPWTCCANWPVNWISNRLTAVAT